MSEEPVMSRLTALPDREALRNRWLEALGLTDKQAQEALQYPYNLSNHLPRYYQEGAINRAVIAVLQAKRGLHTSRILLTLATGTGKTKIAFQLVWKLKRTRAIRNVLYLTDRDWLLSQAMDNDFAPFGDARDRIRGEAATSHDILFATYQAMADNETRSGPYRDFPRDFFDVIIVDECHRGSAQADSRWRVILEHCESAVQIGMTATPLSTEMVQTDEYFGRPIYSYSLRMGINDGFLAPYRVRRVLMGPKQEKGQTEEPEEVETQDDSDIFSRDEEENALSDNPIIEETSATLEARTRVIAQHLAAYMQHSDPLGKTIVFCVDQEHAEKMREALEQTCAEFATQYRGYVERIVSEEGHEGRRALGRFTTPDERTPVIVTTSRLLSTGVDVPTCKNIVLARPVGSLVEFKQIIGRGSRLYEPEKTWFTIVDYAGAIKLFFDPNFDGDPELVEVEPLVPQPQAEQEETGVGTEVPTWNESPGVTRIPTTPLIRDGGETYPQSESSGESPPPVSPLPPAAIEEKKERSEQGSVVIPTTQQPANFPHVLQPPVSIHVSVASVPKTEPPAFIKQLKNGITIQVIGEDVYDLGPDGKTLRSRSSYRDYTAAILHSIVTKPEELRMRWLSREQREALRDQLEEEGVKLQAIAEVLHLPEVDPLDILLHVAFGQRVLARSERVERLYREHAEFFNKYRPEARKILDVILKKYVDGEAQDVSDPELLKVRPLSEQGTFMELARLFDGGAKVRSALKELQNLLYSA